MNDVATLTQLTRQVLDQNQQLLGVLETLAQTEKIRAQLDLNAHGDPWVPAGTLAQQLGPAFSRETILSDLHSGLFKFQRDYIHTGKSRDPWAFKKSRVEAVYSLPPEKRRQWPVEAA